MRNNNTDTSLRYIAMLGCIPVNPGKISIADIRSKLEQLSPDYRVDIRTVQRDMERLSGKFPLTSVASGRTNYWSWVDKNALTLIPGMSPQTALAFNLAEDHLHTLLPGSTFNLLSAYFQRAREVLKGSRFSTWSQNIRAITRGPYLIPPKINPAIQDTVYEGLLNEKQLDVKYRTRGASQEKNYVLNPLGLVSRGGAIYLVATAWHYEDPRHFMLSRVRKATLLNERSRRPANFNLDTYISEQGEFAYPYSDKQLALELSFDADAGFIFSEFKLSADQIVTQRDDDEIRVTATVRDDAEIRWWLLGFGDQVEIIKPARLRKEFQAIAKNMAGYYRN